MADRPIIFSGPMVRALLDGRKTQTRRVLKAKSGIIAARSVLQRGARWMGIEYDRAWPLRLPYAPGDRLWVREAWSINTSGGFSIGGVGDWGYSLDFRAGGTKHLRFSGHYAEDPYMRLYDTQVGDWRPSIHMPRWASRITLTVTDVRVQRLQEISEDDARAEGLETQPSPLGISLHGPDAWDANPWVVALTFTVQRGNIDEAPQ